MRGMGGMGNMMAQAQRMQAKLAQVQEEIKQMEVEGTAANGMVKVVMTGAHRVKRVSIDPSVMDPEDAEMLEDLITLACNDCVERIEKISERRLRAAVPLPAGMKFPF